MLPSSIQDSTLIPSLAGRGISLSSLDWRHNQFVSLPKNIKRAYTYNRASFQRPHSSSFPLNYKTDSTDQSNAETTPPISKPPNKLGRFGLTSLPKPTQSPRDTIGRSLAGRKKPLKINLDLALYRARQVRIEANRATLSKERSRLSREAESALRRCLEMDPEDGRAYVILGKMLVTQRRYEEAEALYEAGCAATGGSNAHIWTAWAYFAAQRRNTSLARRLYDAAVVASPAHAAAYHGWGLLEKTEGRFLQARDIWIKGINATGSNANPYLYQSLAVLASELDKPDEARKWFRAGTKTVIGASSHALWHAWAIMEQKLKTDPAAIRALYRRGLQTSPRSRYIFLSWALWERSQGNIEEARKLFRSGSHLNRRDAALPQAWALMEEEQGAIKEARRLFNRASKADPTHLYVWQAWGCMEQRCGNIDAARELFQQGIWAAPPREKDVSLIFQAWAVLEREAANIQLARELFKCAVKANAKSEPSWLAWAEMEEDQGCFERANELRSFNMQERQEIAMPANFTTLPSASKESQQGLLKPLFDQVNKWFLRYEAGGDGGSENGRRSGTSGNGSGNGKVVQNGVGLRTLLDMSSDDDSGNTSIKNDTIQ